MQTPHKKSSKQISINSSGPRCKYISRLPCNIVNNNKQNDGEAREEINSSLKQY